MMPTDLPDAGLDLGLWLSISEIAEKKKKSRQAISKRVKALIAEGKLETREGKNKTKLVNLAAYDDAVGEVGDPSKEQAAETAQAVNVDTPTESNRFRDASTRAKEYDADIKFIELGKQLGRLVPIEDVEAAAIKIAETMVLSIDRLPNVADKIHAASSRDGVAGVRAGLKEIARDLRASLAESLESLAATAVAPTIDTTQSPIMDSTDAP